MRPSEGPIVGAGYIAKIWLQDQQSISNMDQDLIMHSLGVRCPMPMLVVPNSPIVFGVALLEKTDTPTQAL